MSALRLALEQEKEERWEKLQRRLEAVQQRRVARLNEMQRRSLTQSASSSMDVLDEGILAGDCEGGDSDVVVKTDETIIAGKDKINNNHPHNVNGKDEGASQIDSLSVEDKRVKGVRGGATTVSAQGQGLGQGLGSAQGPGLGQHINHHDNDRNRRLAEGEEEDKENAAETSCRSAVTQPPPQSKSQSSSQSQSSSGLDKASSNNNITTTTTTTIINTPTDLKLSFAVTTTTSISSSQSKEKKKKHKKRSGVGSGQEVKDDDWFLLATTTKASSVSVKAVKTVPIVPVGGTRTPTWHAYACSLLLEGVLKKKNVWLARQAALTVSTLNVSFPNVTAASGSLFDLYLETVKRPSSLGHTSLGAGAVPGSSPCLSSVDGLLRVLCLAPGLVTTTATATTSSSTVTPQSVCEELLALFARFEGTTSTPSLVPGASPVPSDPKREMGLFLRQGGVLLLRALLGGDGGVLTRCLPAASASSSSSSSSSNSGCVGSGDGTTATTSGVNGTSSSSSSQPLSLCILRTPRLLPFLCRALCTAASVMSHTHQPTLVDQVIRKCRRQRLQLFIYRTISYLITTCLAYSFTTLSIYLLVNLYYL